MTYTEFQSLFDKNLEEIKALMNRKGNDYTDGRDRLSNFKEQAKRLGMTPYQVWAVYANKHWDAINAFVRNNGQLESEPIESRIHDIIVYSFLLLGIVQETTAPTVTGIRDETRDV